MGFQQKEALGSLGDLQAGSDDLDDYVTGSLLWPPTQILARSLECLHSPLVSLKESAGIPYGIPADP